MARELRWWVLGTLGACLALAGIYLPPGGHSLWPDRRTVQREPPSPYRLRERTLARRLRGVEEEVRLLEAREQVTQELARRRALNAPGPVLRFSGSDTIPTAVRDLIAAQLDTIWKRLDLGVTKIGIGVLLDTGTGRQSPSYELYLLPDSTDRTTCLVQLPVIFWSRGLANFGKDPSTLIRFRLWLESGLGPCAFYAAFGAPGRAIGHWLSARSFDLALSPTWSSAESAGSPTREEVQQEYWFREEAYRLSPGALGCLAHREVSCREQVLDGSRSTDSIRHLVGVGVWRWDPPALVGADHYLADVAATIGPTRFQRFWNSELPVDTALAEALREPVGEWTRRWEEAIAPRIRLGPAAPLSAVLLSLVLATMAVGWVARTARRREVG